MVITETPACSYNRIFLKIHTSLLPKKFMLTPSFSETLHNRCLICWRLSFGWEREIFASRKKKGLLFLMFLPSRKADGSIRLKAQRTAISFVILEEEGNQFKIGKSLPTTDGVQYEIYSDIKLFVFWPCIFLDLVMSKGLRFSRL